MSEAEDEAAAGGDRDSDVVGKVLGSIEGYQAVEADVLPPIGEHPQVLVEGDALPGEAIDSILDGSAGAGEMTAEGAQSLDQALRQKERPRARRLILELLSRSTSARSKMRLT